MMMIGADPDRGAELTPRSDLSGDSSSSDIVGTPGVGPFTWEEEEAGRAEGPGERMFESVLASTSRWPDLQTSGSENSSPETHNVKLNLRASLMGVHILDDETEMFFSRQASSNAHNGASVPFTWEVDPGPPLQQSWQEPSMGPLTPPAGSRAASGILYPGQQQPLLYQPPGRDAQGMHFSEKVFKKLIGKQSIDKRRGESSTETLDRHFGHYSSDMRYDPDNDSVSPTSTLDHPETESSPSSESERYFPSRNPNLARYLDRARDSSTSTTTRPSSQLAQCLLSLTAMADDTTDEDDIIFEQPSTAAPLSQAQPTEAHRDWPIVQYQPPPKAKSKSSRPPRSSTTSPKSGRTVERWSSNSSSWNLSLLSKPSKSATVTKVSVTTKKPRRPSSSVTLREVHTGASTSTAYDRSGDAHGRHKWERGSSGSLPSVEELGFEAYDRPGEMAHTLDEEDFPFSPIASSFVFGEHNNSVEFSQRGGRSGIPRAVGPIVQEFTSNNFEIVDFQETMSNLSEGSHTYSLESGFLQPAEQDWMHGSTKSFHYIKGPSVEIVEIGTTSSRCFNGYVEINHSGRFSIDLQRGPRLERHQGWSAAIEKTPDVLLRIVEEASSMSHRRRSNATKYGCFSTCRCLPVRKKGLLGRCLTSNQTHRVAVANSFESRLRSRSLGSVSAQNHYEFS